MIRFKQFYIDHGDKLFGYLLRKSGNVHLTADLVQETFTRYMERYSSREQSPGLLFTMARNLFYDQMRFNKRFVSGEEISHESVPGQEESYIAKEGMNEILAAMEQLGDDERDILALVVSSDMTYREIACIRQCSVDVIKVKVHRARQKLKKLLLESKHG